MAIRRDDVDQGKVDFSDVATGSRLPLIHLGEILRDEFLEPMDISVYKLAKALKVSRPRLNDLVLGRRSVSTDTALRLGRYFGTSPEFWLALQTRYDLDAAAPTLRPLIEREVQPHAAHGFDDVSELLRDLNETRKSESYGDVPAPELDAEETASQIEAYVEAVRTLIGT